MVVLVGGRLYALAHGVRQKVAHLGVAAGVDVVEGTLLDAGGQWCGKAASLALGGRGAVGGARFIGRNETLDLSRSLKRQQIESQISSE